MTGKTTLACLPPSRTLTSRARLKQPTGRNKDTSGLWLKARQWPSLPFPYIHDIPGLHRSSYPYDYECEWAASSTNELGSIFHTAQWPVPPGWSVMICKHPSNR
jgi:hypothetical protein